MKHKKLLAIIPASMAIMAMAFIPSCSKSFNVNVTCTNCTINGKTQFSESFKENTEVVLSNIKADSLHALAKDVEGTRAGQKLVQDIDYWYSKESGEIKFIIKGDTSFKIDASNIGGSLLLNDYSWSEIRDISVHGIARDYFAVGDTKDVLVNGVTHKVRIIGFNQDYTELPLDGGTPDPNKAIGITFEFADLISDENGFCLAASWDSNTASVGNHDYMNSGIRAVLNDAGAGQIDWFQYFGLEEDEGKNRRFSDNYGRVTVLKMLPEYLVSQMTAPSKYIMVYSNPIASEWEEVTVKDKLFLLSPREMNYEDWTPVTQEPSTSPYTYYEDCSPFSMDAKRIKHQVQWKDGFRTAPLNTSTSLIGAGYNYGIPPEPTASANDEEEFGGCYWLRSPSATLTDNQAWCIDCSGEAYSNYGLTPFPGTNFNVLDAALAVAPAFCI